MNNILFVCTGNIFRSRFAEEVFNHLCKINGVDATAFSAGLQVGRYKQRKIYWPAMNELERLKIEPLRSNEESVHIDDIDVSIYDQIICMDEEEPEAVEPVVTALENVKNTENEPTEMAEPVEPELTAAEIDKNESSRSQETS